MSFKKILILPVSLFALACSSQTQPQSIATGASCGSLEGADETLASLYQPGTVYKATPIKEKVFHARALQPEMVMGASLSVRADSDMNAPYMQRVLSCHAAQALVEHPNDPLHPSTGSVAELSVEQSKFGYRIHVRGDNPKVGAEIWQRAEALSDGKASVKVEQLAKVEPQNGQL